jgi:hypothetical protein
VNDNRGTVTILYRREIRPVDLTVCACACGRRNRNLNRPRDGQQVLSRSRFNRVRRLFGYTSARGRPPYMRGPYGKNGPVTSLIHLLLLATSAIDLSSRESIYDFFRRREGERTRERASRSLIRGMHCVHRSTADGQKERKTERLTQARLEATGDKLTSRRRRPSRSLRVDRSPKVWRPGRRRERGDRTSRFSRAVSLLAR